MFVSLFNIVVYFHASLLSLSFAGCLKGIIGIASKRSLPLSLSHTPSLLFIHCYFLHTFHYYFSFLTLLDRSTIYLLLADFYVEIFCVKAENFFNVCWYFSAFPASFCLLVFAGTYQQQGETLPNFIHEASSRHIFIG